MRMCPSTSYIDLSQSLVGVVQEYDSTHHRCDQIKHLSSMCVLHSFFQKFTVYIWGYTCQSNRFFQQSQYYTLISGGCH